jgi:hypothetical protein
MKDQKEVFFLIMQSFPENELQSEYFRSKTAAFRARAGSQRRIVPARAPVEGDSTR